MKNGGKNGVEKSVAFIILFSVIVCFPLINCTGDLVSILSALHAFCFWNILYVCSSSLNVVLCYYPFARECDENQCSLKHQVDDKHQTQCKKSKFIQVYRYRSELIRKTPSHLSYGTSFTLIHQIVPRLLGTASDVSRS